MNEGQIKTKIFLISVLDWILYIIMVAIGVYAVLYSQSPILVGIIAIAGLLIISKMGDNLRNRIAGLRIDLEKHRKLVAKNFGSIR